jgi:hypothetical protein
MKLIGTVLRCSARKVNSSSKETYVTNLLVLDPENSGGTNYAVEVWDDKPHQVTPMSEVAVTVVGIVNKSGVPAKASRGGGPGCGNPGCGVSGYRRRRRKGKTANLRRNSRFKDSRQRFLYPFRYHPSLGMSHRGCPPGWVTHPR